MELNQQTIGNQLDIKRLCNTHIEGDILTFLTAYNIPPYDYVKQFLRISENMYDTIENVIWF